MLILNHVSILCKGTAEWMEERTGRGYHGFAYDFNTGIVDSSYRGMHGNRIAGIQSSLEGLYRKFILTSSTGLLQKTT